MKRAPKKIIGYETTDGKVFTGKEALVKSKEHQKHLNMRDMRKKLEDEIRSILDILVEDESDGETNEELFIEKVSGFASLPDFDGFIDFTELLVDLFLADQRMPKIFDAIKRRYDNM